MIALQILLVVSAVLGMAMAPFEFRRARSAYASWRESGQNGLGLQVAAHQVRLAVANVMVHASLAMLSLLTLCIMLTGWRASDLDLVLTVTVTVLSMQLMASQAMSRYDYGLIVDHAIVAAHANEEERPARGRPSTAPKSGAEKGE